MTGRAEPVPAWRPRRKLGALAAAGHTATAIVAAMGRPVTGSARSLVHQWRQPDREHIDAAIAAGVDLAWQTLAGHPPARPRTETRLAAWRAGHRPPEWWAGQDIDDPYAEPVDPRADPDNDQGDSPATAEPTDGDRAA